MADLTLAYMRKVFNWHAVRTEFRSPIVRGMARTKPLERARDRVLTDDELRKVWRAAGDMKNAFGPFVRFTLLTATRREEAASMRRSDPGRALQDQAQSCGATKQSGADGAASHAGD
jgi:integrase